MHVLFITEKWADQPGGPLTNTFHNLFGSFAATGLGGLANVYLDEGPGSVDDRIEQAVKTARPEFIVISLLRQAKDRRPSRQCLARLRRMGLPIIFIWWDAVHADVLGWADWLTPYAAAHVIVDHNDFSTRLKRLAMWVPQDPELYHDPGLRRDIDVCFVGSLNAEPCRRSGLDALRANGIACVHAGGQHEQNLSPQDYAKYHQRAKISLNFSHSTGKHQSKGRIWEVLLCGAALFESENPQIKRWFVPWVDYVPFLDEKDLVTLVRHFLAHDREREAIAVSGKEKAKTLYSARAWWHTVFDYARQNQCGWITVDMGNVLWYKIMGRVRRKLGYQS